MYELDNKFIKHFEEKSFSVLRGLNGLPSSTDKNFFRLNILLFFLTDHEKYHFYSFLFFSQPFAGIDQQSKALNNDCNK